MRLSTGAVSHLGDGSRYVMLFYAKHCLEFMISRFKLSEHWYPSPALQLSESSHTEHSVRIELLTCDREMYVCMTI